MILSGHFTVEQHAYPLGAPIPATLVIANEGDHEICLFVPHGRADGVHFEVHGGVFHQKSMAEEPEPGLVAEERLLPGDIYRKAYLLSEWLTFEEPGDFVVTCKVEIPFYEVSTQTGGEERSLGVTTDLYLTVLPAEPRCSSDP